MSQQPSKSRAIGDRLISAFLIVGWLACLISSASAGDGPQPSRDELQKLLVENPDAAQLRAINNALVRRSLARDYLSDNDIIVPWLQEHANRVRPTLLFELALHAFPDDHDKGLEWFGVGLARIYYDSRRCTDDSAGNDMLFLIMLRAGQGPIGDYLHDHPQAYADALKRALARPDVFVDELSPLWICSHSLQVYKDAIAGQAVSPGSLIKPRNEWPGIKEDVRQQLLSVAESKMQPRDKP